MAETFESQLLELLTGLYGRSWWSRGVSNASIQAAENRLGVRMPEVLRAAYRVAGNHRGLLQGLQRLAPVERLEMRSFEPDRRALVFLAEQRQVTFSCVLVEETTGDDPVVFQLNPSEEVLYEHCASLATFLMRCICWNAVELQPHSGVCQATESQFERMRNDYAVVGFQGKAQDYEPRALVKAGLSLCAFHHPERKEPSYDCYVASRDSKALRDFSAKYGLDMEDF